MAVFATARKLVQMDFRLMHHGQPYVDTGVDAYEARFAQRRLITYTKALKDMGYKVEFLKSPGAAVAA